MAALSATLRPKLLFFQAVFWSAVALGGWLIWNNYFYKENITVSLSGILLPSGVSVTVFYINFLFLAPRYFLSQKTVPYIIAVIITIAATTSVWYFITPGGVLIKLAWLLYIYFFSMLFAYMAHTLGNRDAVITGAKSRNDFELNMLKSQFNPHFLFNTLNIIYSKCHSESPEAAGMIQQLSSFMRYLINDCSKGKVLLQKEIEMLHDYINLYKQNYHEGLAIIFKHRLFDQGQKIAPMLLLNFVENAFKHSHIAAKKNAYVNIELATDQHYLLFKVTNNKAPIANRLEKGVGNGLTVRQLELMYPNRYEYKVTETEKEYEVFLKIKL